MKQSRIIYALVAGLVIGFVVAFVYANVVNRNELDHLRSDLSGVRVENEELKARVNEQAIAPAAEQVSDEELRSAVARADANPADYYLQRTLGQGLYLYAGRDGGDVRLLTDAIRLLRRAYTHDSHNYDTLVLLGNALFALGRASDTSSLAEARTFYQQALRVKPTDLNVRIDLGATYFFDKPSQPARAVEEYRRVLAANPHHERALQQLAAALIAQNKFDEAGMTLDELQNANPANPELSNLQAQLTQSLNQAQEKN